MQKSIHYIAVGYLTLLIMLKMLALPLLCLQFDMNRDFIAGTLCENKDKPQMHCSGSCVLNKHMDATGDMGNTSNQKSNFQLTGVDFFEALPNLEFSLQTSSIPAVIKYISSLPAVGFTGKIFHPPIAA